MTSYINNKTLHNKSINKLYSDQNEDYRIKLVQ